MFHYTALTWTDCPIWWCPHGTSFEPGLWKSSRRQQRWARDSGNESSGQVIEAIDKFRVFTSWLTNTCKVADFLSFFDSQTWADKQNGSVQMLWEQPACHPFIQVLKQRNEDIWCWRWRKRRSGDTEKCLWSCIAGYCASICCWDKTRTWWNHDCLPRWSRGIWVPKSVKHPKLPR